MSSYVVSREAYIPASPAAIFAEVNDFRRWTAWSPWEQVDPQMQRSDAGSTSGVGARYAWNGNRKAGAGTMEIVRSDADQQIEIRLEFSKPFEAVNPTTFTFTPEGDRTKVTWSMTGENKGMGKVFSLFMSMDKLVGGDFEKGLAALHKAVAGRHS